MSRYSADAAWRVWRERLGRFRGSDLPVARFCGQEGVSAASFYNWRKRLAAGGGRQRSRDGAAFQRLTVVPAAGVSIHLTCGTRIEIRAGDLDAIRAVVAEVIRSRSDDVSC